MKISPLDTTQAQGVKNGTSPTEAVGFKASLAKAQDGMRVVDPQAEAKLRQACKDMEAVFLNMMWSSMRATVPKSSLTGESNQKEILQSMLDSEMTKNMAQSGGVGLADMLYRQLSATLPQEQGGQYQKPVLQKPVKE